MKETTSGQSFKSSKSFFTQLDEKTSTTSNGKLATKKKRSIDNNQINAKRLKL